MMDLRTRNELLAVLPRLRRFARGLTGSSHDADDLVQIACERAIRNIGQWNPTTRMDSWLYRIVQTAWIDSRRANKVRADYAAAVTATATEEHGGEDQTVAALTVGAVDAALQQLPEEQRNVLLLVCVEQLSYAQAAEVLRIPVGTVMSRLARGRLALRRLVDGPNADAEPDPLPQAKERSA